MSEEDLTTNEKHPIIRIGDNVHRPTNWWTPAVHELLKYLESIDFKYSPRVLGFDEKGREVLSFMNGESGKSGWYKIHSDQGLKNYAKLLRDYHDAVASYRPSKDSIWAYATGGLKANEIVSHGDFGPWNITWDGENPIGIIDWDFVFPAEPSYDIFYALEYSAPFRDDKLTREWHHFEDVPDRKHRIDIFLESYGINRQKLGDVVTGVAKTQRIVAGNEKYLADRGLQPQLDLVENGDLELSEKRAQWTENNRLLFE